MTAAIAPELKQPRHFQLGSTWQGPSGVHWQVIDESAGADSPDHGEIVLRRLNRIAGTKGPNTLVRRKLVPLGWKLVCAVEAADG
jgi:hypothetical protein